MIMARKAKGSKTEENSVITTEDPCAAVPSQEPSIKDDTCWRGPGNLIDRGRVIHPGEKIPRD